MNTKWLAAYLNFSRKDRIGQLIILTLTFLMLIAPTFLPRNINPMISQTDSSFTTAIRKLEIQQSGKGNSSTQDDAAEKPIYNSKTVHPNATLFYFDPNTLAVEGWRKLGLREKTITTIQNYIGHGGHFKTSDDLQHIYGLEKTDFERLKPYVKIVSSESSNLNTEKKFVRTPRAIQTIEINTADTSTFIALPGIGSKLANRIVNFRDKLGGFYSVDQLGETFSLADSTFQKIKPFLVCDNGKLRKLHLNEISLDDLKSHPYIRYNIANAIVNYRNEHGRFNSIDDLKKIMAVTEDIYKKMMPYLTIE